MLIFGLRSTSDDWPGWLMDSNPICHACTGKKMKCSFLDYVQLLMIGWAGRWTRTRSAALSSQKNEMLIFGLHSTSDDRPGWSMDLNHICHPSPAKKATSWHHQYKVFRYVVDFECYRKLISIEIFMFSQVSVVADHSLDSFQLAWKNEPCSEVFMQNS